MAVSRGTPLPATTRNEWRLGYARMAIVLHTSQSTEIVLEVGYVPTGGAPIEAGSRVVGVIYEAQGDDRLRNGSFLMVFNYP